MAVQRKTRSAVAGGVLAVEIAVWFSADEQKAPGVEMKPALGVFTGLRRGAVGAGAELKANELSGSLRGGLQPLGSACVVGSGWILSELPSKLL